MNKIMFVTGNEGKVKYAQKYFSDIELVYYKYDLIEPRSESLEEIAKYKVIQAYEIVNTDCIALDSGFYIESLNGWPGTFVNFNLEKLGLEGFLKLLSFCENRQAYFKECLAYYDGKEIKYFFGIAKGSISTTISDTNYPNQWSQLWRIFIPDNCSKTMSDMNDEEIDDLHKNKTSSLILFKKYLER